MQNLIKNVLEKHKISVSNEQAEKLAKFYELVIFWNEKINLTAITEKNDFVYKHIIDSLLPLDKFPLNSKVIDVGAGAGFPSIPLKILRDDLKITMIDSLNKRVSFLNNVISQLELKDISAVHSRAEEFANNFVYREKFDVATARAVAPLPTLLEYLLPFVKNGGEVIAYKSIQSEVEIKSAGHALNILGGRIENICSFKINEISSDRNVIIIKKINSTPKNYPRGGNKPKISPL